MRHIAKKTVHAAKRKPFHAAFFSLVVMIVASLGVIIAFVVSSNTYASPPFSFSPPPISGFAAVGQDMTVSDGVWSGNPTFTFQWQRCDSGGNNCVDISGATSNTYTLTGSESGGTVRAMVTADDAGETTTVPSELSGVVQAMIGDLNNDSVINVFDLGMLLGHYGSQSSPAQDFVGDGIINSSDVNYLLNLYQP